MPLEVTRHASRRVRKHLGDVLRGETAERAEAHRAARVFAVLTVEEHCVDSVRGRRPPRAVGALYDRAHPRLPRGASAVCGWAVIAFARPRRTVSSRPTATSIARCASSASASPSSPAIRSSWSPPAAPSLRAARPTRPLRALNAALERDRCLEAEDVARAMRAHGAPLPPPPQRPRLSARGGTAASRWFTVTYR